MAATRAVAVTKASEVPWASCWGVPRTCTRSGMSRMPPPTPMSPPRAPASNPNTKGIAFVLMEARTVSQLPLARVDNALRRSLRSYRHIRHGQPTADQAFAPPVDAALPRGASRARQRDRDLRDQDRASLPGRGAGEALRGDRAHGGAAHPVGSAGRALSRDRGFPARGLRDRHGSGGGGGRGPRPVAEAGRRRSEE